MRNLLQLIRRSGVQAARDRRRRPASAKRSDVGARRLSSEQLERRELLASDILASHNYYNPYDVNNDSQVTASDALTVVNHLSRRNEASGETAASLSGQTQAFVDVNADGSVTPADALSVINVLGRGEGNTDPVIEFHLSASTPDGQLIAPENGAINLELNELVDLEIGYRDLRQVQSNPAFPESFNPIVQPLGLFQIVADIVPDQAGFLQPVMYETQTITFSKDALRIDSDVTQLVYTNGPGGGSSTANVIEFQSEADVFASFVTALTDFGYNEQTDFEVQDLSDNNNYQFFVKFDGSLGNLDLPDVNLDLVEVTGDDFTASTTTLSPVLPDGELNPLAVRPNIDFRSRSLAGESNEFFYGRTGDPPLKFGTLDEGNLVKSGSVGVLSGSGVPGNTNYSFLNFNGAPNPTPFHAYSFRYRIVQPVTNLNVDLMASPSEGDGLDNLVYGSYDVNDPDANQLSLDQISQGPGTARLVFNVVGTELSIAPVNADQAEGNTGTTDFTFEVTRSGDTTTAVDVNYSVSGGVNNPADAADFGGTLPTGTLSFAAEETVKTIIISVSGDIDVEEDESFTVTLSDPSSGVSFINASAPGTIQNDDQPSELSIAASDANKLEGDIGNTLFEFTVTRNGDTTRAVEVDFTVSGDGTDPANADDFAGGTFPTGTVSFEPGETSQPVFIEVNGDTVVEADEGFAVNLNNQSLNAILVVSGADGLIVNDDASLSIAETSAVKAEGDSGSTSFTFTVTRNGDPTGQAIAAFTVTGNGANPADGEDFVGAVFPSGFVTFEDGETSKTLTIDVSGDTDVEEDEGFTVTLSEPEGASLDVAAASGVIQNDDASLSIVATDATKAEGDSGTTSFIFLVSRVGDTSRAASANYSVTGSGSEPADAEDFGGELPGGTVSFEEGETSKEIIINVSGDLDVEGDEGFTVTLSAPTGATLENSTADGVIQNDDASLSITNADASKAEGDSGETIFTFTVTRNGDTSGAASAQFSVAGSGPDPADAEDFVDVVLPTGLVSFEPGQASSTINIRVNGDTDVENDEGFSVTLSEPEGASLETDVAFGLIQNDDGDLTISSDDSSQPEGNTGTTAFVFTVTRRGDTSEAIVVNYSVSGIGTDPADAEDFGGTLPTGTVNFAVGETTKEITISVSGDTDVENDEGFRLTATSPGLGSAISDGVIENDDTSLSIVATDATKLEGDVDSTLFSFTVTRSGLLTAASTANYAVIGSGADPADADDFGGELPSGIVEFAAGEATKVVNVQVSGDLLIEADNGFAVTLSDPVGATIVSGVAEGLIQNDDAPGQLAIEAGKTVGEQDVIVTLVVTRTDGRSGEVTVDYATADDTAIAGQDYVQKNGTLTFAQGELSQSIEIQIVDDILGSETTEQFKVLLSEPGGGATLGNSEAVVTIENVNLPPSVGDPVVIGAVTERASTFTITQEQLLENATDREDELAVSGFNLVDGDSRGVQIGENSLTVTPTDYGFLVDDDNMEIVYSYLISDGFNAPLSQTVKITIEGINDPPEANDDTGYETFQRVPVTIDVLANDNAGNGESQQLSVVAASSEQGVVTINQDGDLVFTPGEGVVGQAVIDYTMTDDQGLTDTAQVFVEVREFQPSSISGAIFIDHVENMLEVINGAAPDRNGVKDEDEDGLGGVLVRLVSQAGENSLNQAVDITKLTDLDGSYTFENLAPGVYTVIYEAPDTVIYAGQSNLQRRLDEPGGFHETANYALHGTQGSALHSVDLLATSYLTTNQDAADISDNGREGGLVSLRDDGTQEFVIAYAGFEGNKAIEFALSDDHSSALLSLVKENGQVMTAMLSYDQFVLSPDGKGAQFFGGQEDFDFATQVEFDEDDYDTYMHLVDQVLADM